MVKRAISADEAPHRTDSPTASGASQLARRQPAAVRPTVRIGARYVDWLAERLSARDWAIIQEVNRLRAASGLQLERLCFTALALGRSRTVTRSRVLKRLVEWRVLAPVGRRVGGKAKGSTVQVFALDRAGQRLMGQRQLTAGERVRVRRPGVPGRYALSHLLAVSELYVETCEQARAAGVAVAELATEPGCHWPNGLGGWLKPDAYVVLERPGARDHWWLEVDLATESLPTVRGKIQTYLDFQARGGRGPDDTMPWVLISTTTAERRDAIAGVVRRLPGARELVTVDLSTKAALHMIQVLQK